MGILRTDRVAGLGGAKVIKGSVKFTSGGALDIDLDGATIGTGNFTMKVGYISLDLEQGIKLLDPHQIILIFILQVMMVISNFMTDQIHMI